MEVSPANSLAHDQLHSRALQVEALPLLPVAASDMVTLRLGKYAFVFPDGNYHLRLDLSLQNGESNVECVCSQPLTCTCMHVRTCACHPGGWLPLPSTGPATPGQGGANGPSGQGPIYGLGYLAAAGATDGNTIYLAGGGLNHDHKQPKYNSVAYAWRVTPDISDSGSGLEEGAQQLEPLASLPYPSAYGALAYSAVDNALYFTGGANGFGGLRTAYASAGRAL